MDPFVKTVSVSELNTAGRAGIDGALAEVLSSSTDGIRERERDQDLSSGCHEESDRTRPGGLKEGITFPGSPARSALSEQRAWPG